MISIGKKVKKMLQNWLEVIPAAEQTVILNEKYTHSTEILRAQLWYRGDSDELRQFFSQLGSGNGSFWSSVPKGSKVRKIHSGLPAIMADSIAYIIKSDIEKVSADMEKWDDISEKIKLTELIGDAVVDTLVDGDGAFKISVDTDLSPYPIVEFVGGDMVDYEISRGVLTAVTFRSAYVSGSRRYILNEVYRKGSIESFLTDEYGKDCPFDDVPELSGTVPVVTFSVDYIMAVPLKFYKSKKHKGRGKSIFDGGRSDNFDALDEVLSQWIDAIRDGRVQKYIPEDLIPRNPNDGSLQRVNSFGTEFIMVNSSLGDDDASKITTVQPDIKYEAFVATYTNIMLLCLQGILSPATLGIDVGKMSSGEAQREKKDVTGNTRNTITTALANVLPQLVSAICKTYDNMLKRPIGEYEVKVSFGEYGAPDFDSRVETIGKAASYGVMSTETQVEELWGSSKTDTWKAAEVQRVKAEKGLEVGGDTSVGDEL